MNPSRQWIAGFFDGEGGMSLGWGVRVMLHITNTKLEWLEDIQALYGGYIYQLNKTRKTKKPCYRWIISREKEVERFADEVLIFSRKFE